jgi:ribosomal protein S1
MATSPAARLFEELLRRSPSSMPGLKGKVLAGHVIASKHSDKFVDVDVGFKGSVTLLRSELGPGGASAAPGDIFPVVVEHLETPLGEMQLNGERAREQERLESVWQELRGAHARGAVVQVCVCKTLCSSTGTQPYRKPDRPRARTRARCRSRAPRAPRAAC